MIGHIFKIIKKIFFDRNSYWLYVYIPKMDEVPIPDPNVREYGNTPEGVAKFKQLMGKFWWANPLYVRLRSNMARFFTYEVNGKVLAYGFDQTWEPFRTKFGDIYKDATALGPHRTKPEIAGKGIFKILLQHNISTAPKHLPIVGFTHPDNIKSQKGLLKVGFEKVGAYRITVFFRTWVFTEKLGE